MRGLDAQFGPTVFGGMANVLKVRDNQVGYEDPGWYLFPEGTVSSRASHQELERDGIDPGDVPARSTAHDGHGE